MLNPQVGKMDLYLVSAALLIDRPVECGVKKVWGMVSVFWGFRKAEGAKRGRFEREVQQGSLNYPIVGGESNLMQMYCRNFSRDFP